MSKHSNNLHPLQVNDSMVPVDKLGYLLEQEHLSHLSFATMKLNEQCSAKLNTQITIDFCNAY